MQQVYHSHGRYTIAVISRIATLRMDDTATHTTNALQWQATAVTQDTAAGSSVDVTIVRTVVGVPPADPDTLTLKMYDDAGTLIRQYTLGVATASQTVNFSFTNDGLSTGTARAGTVEIAIRATRTSAGTYDVETDATPNTPPATFDTHLDRGWIRGTTTASTVLAGTGLLAYNDTLTATTTLGVAPYNSKTLNVALSPVGATASVASTTTSFTTSLGVVDNRFPASSANRTTAVTFPNSDLTTLPWTTATLTETTRTIDPRLTITDHLMQLDSTMFSTPPMSSNEASGQRPQSSIAYLATRLANANSVYLNGLTMTVDHTPVKPGDAERATGIVTANRGGQDGWTSFMTWDNQLPGGSWIKTITITAPSNITGSGYVLNNSVSYVLNAINPDLALWGYINKTSPARRHFSAGEPIVINCSIENIGTKIRVDPADVSEIKCSVRRFNSSNNTMEYLNSSEAWVTWGATVAAHGFPMTASANDPRLYIKEFTNTTSWTKDIRVDFIGKVNGVSYYGTAFREEVDSINPHDDQEFDAVGIFK